MAEMVGFEPTTYGLTVRRYYQLSYISIIDGGQGQIRTTEDECQWIYSPPQLAALVPTRKCGNAYTAIYYKPYSYNELLAAASYFPRASTFPRYEPLLISNWSGRQDSNLQFLGPKPRALPNLATPRYSRHIFPIQQIGDNGAILTIKLLFVSFFIIFIFQKPIKCFYIAFTIAICNISSFSINF